MENEQGSKLFLCLCFSLLTVCPDLHATSVSEKNKSEVITSFYRQNGVQTQSLGRTLQNNTQLVKGTVVDATGEPIIGATIKVSGSNEATISDVDGHFQIYAPATSRLQISYIGYADQEVNVQGRQNIKITMSVNQKVLDEVVVIGYGTTTKRSITGAVDQIKSSLLENKPVANVTQALQGASPNLIIQRKSYNPNGESNNLNIRGISTTNSNSPLIVIDGLVMNDGSLNDMNPNDIENISILKDAGAAAIYGSLFQWCHFDYNKERTF